MLQGTPIFCDSTSLDEQILAELNQNGAAEKFDQILNQDKVVKQAKGASNRGIGALINSQSSDCFSIRNRLKSLQDDINRTKGKEVLVKELIGLFEKYPETLRMLELMRALGL